MDAHKIGMIVLAVIAAIIIDLTVLFIVQEFVWNRDGGSAGNGTYSERDMYPPPSALK